MEKNKIDYEDYFFTKYGSDITDLFLNVRGISDSFCVNIFNSTNQVRNGSNELSAFIFDKIILEDEINSEEENKDKHELEDDHIIV